jgi:TetR/AcrR family transcriptional regulator
MGSGKSSVAVQLKQMLGGDNNTFVLDLDRTGEESMQDIHRALNYENVVVELSDGGWHSTEAGVNEVTLFRKFKSKENILQAVIIYHRDSALNKLNSVFLHRGGETNLHTSLIQLSRSLISFMNERIDLMILLLSEGRRKPMVAEIISTIPKELIKQLGEFFDDEMKQGKMRKVDPHLAALSFLGFLLYNTLMKGILYTSKAVDTFVDIFVKGISINMRREKKRSQGEQNIMSKIFMNLL